MTAPASPPPRSASAVPPASSASAGPTPGSVPSPSATDATVERILAQSPGWFEPLEVQVARLLGDLAKPYALQSQEVSVDASAGIALFRRLLRVPSLLAMHLGCILVLLGAMWGSRPGHALLRYAANENVWFEVIRSVDHADPDLFMIFPERDWLVPSLNFTSTSPGTYFLSSM